MRGTAKRIHIILCIAVSACALTLLTAATATAADRLIVGFTPTATAAQEVDALQDAGVAATATTLAATDIPQIDAATVVVPEGDGNEVAAELEQDSRVEYVEVDHKAKVTWTPSDPFLSSQWALTKIGASAAWDLARGAGVLVAVVDTGVDYTHEDLAGGGKVVNGYDFVDSDADAMDVQGHGTHVAGIVAGRGDNATGVAGIAPDANILAVRVLDGDGSGYYSWIASGITYAADHGAKVINLSLGGADSSDVLRDAINYAAARGIFVACASGNEALTTLDYPGRYSNCFTVGATTSGDSRASFSNYGVGLDITAPGDNILSTTMGDGYESWSGTSMAAPYVAGVAALLFSQDLVRSQVQMVLRDTATDRGAAGYDTVYGYGRVNAAAAVTTGANADVLPADDTAPEVTKQTLSDVFRVPITTTTYSWKQYSTTAWKVVASSVYAGTYSWSTYTISGRWKTVYQYKLGDGRIYKRKVVLYKRAVSSTVYYKYRRIALASSDNVGVVRAGVAIDGRWIGSDTNLGNGASVRWRCAAGTHTITVYAFDAQDNMGTAEQTRSVTC